MEEVKNINNEIDEAEAKVYESIFATEDNAENKEENYISIDELDEAEAYSFKDIVAIFDKETGNRVEVFTQTEKVKDEVISDKEKEEITLDKILDELKSRKDIKGLTFDVHIDGKTESFKTSDKQGESISDAVEAIKLAVKDFKDIVIVFSREELENLQKEWRERNGIEEPTEKLDEKEDKSYKEVKAEFTEKINSDESIAKGYIRISDEDYAKLGDALDQNEIPYVASKSDLKVGFNITVPIDKMDLLKEVLSSRDINSLQIVHGNVDWQDIKGTKNMCSGVSKEDFLKFQELNNNKFSYIAFENDKGFSVYMEKDCNIKIKPKQVKKQNKENADLSKHDYQNKKEPRINKNNTFKELESEIVSLKDMLVKNESPYKILHEDSVNIGDLLSENGIPYLVEESAGKDGVNIIFPENKIDQFKKILSDKNIEYQKVTHNNIDWQDIKSKQCLLSDVTKEKLIEFQQQNNNEFNKYIVFENEGKFSVYTTDERNIRKINPSTKSEKNGDVNKRKTVAEVKTDVKNIKNNNTISDLIQINKEKSTNEKER